MSDTPDVLEALSLAIPDCELARHADAAETLTALAVDIEAYRDALARYATADDDEVEARDKEVRSTRRRVLARCRGEQPTQEGGK